MPGAPAQALAMGMYDRILRRVLFLIIILIIYGSLYPWHFRMPDPAPNPLQVLVHAWEPGPARAFLRDTVVNIFLYIPLGFISCLVFRKGRRGVPRLYAPVALGFVLSCAIEIAQVYVPGRQTSMFDVIANVMGSAFGVMLGLLSEQLAPLRSLRDQLAARRVADFAALALTYCWVTWLFFPLMPVVGIYGLSRKLTLFERAPLVQIIPFFSALAIWYALALLLTGAIGHRIPRFWIWLTILAVPAQLLIVDRQPAPSSLFGAAFGILLFTVFHRGKAPTLPEAFGFLGAIVLRGLFPFHFAVSGSRFNWIPFAATLSGDWQFSMAVLIEKVSFYGTAVGLFHRAGFRMVRAIGIVAAVLLAIEIAQLWLPGRTPEITDPILAVLLGFGLTMLCREAREVPASGNYSRAQHGR